MFSQPHRRTKESSGNSVIYIPVDARQIASSSTKTQRNSSINNLYETFKLKFRCLIMDHFRKHFNDFNNNEVLLTIDIGKDTKNKKSHPNLDLGKGDTYSWTMEQTLNQYLEGVPGYNKLLTNMPDFVVNETLRYLHTNKDTKDTAPTKIDENVPFKPVLPNCIKNDGAFIILTNIIPDDSKFLDSLNHEIKQFNPNFKLVIEKVRGNGTEIILSGKPLILCHTFINLVLKFDEESDDSSTVTIADLLKSQNDIQ